IDVVFTTLRHMIISVEIEFTRYLVGAAGVAVLFWLFRRWIASRRIQTRLATFADRCREFRQSFETVCVFAVVNLLTIGMIQAGLIHIAHGVPA
ncbi:hypothetical protein, partial [Salmonella enterica]|uniref:hypothetical protein n=1 Tax=Salmonella enterica TaxID=28901 RepID=UPI003D2B24F4